jgi:hypothetical protein
MMANIQLISLTKGDWIMEPDSDKWQLNKMVRPGRSSLMLNNAIEEAKKIQHEGGKVLAHPVGQFAADLGI